MIHQRNPLLPLPEKLFQEAKKFLDSVVLDVEVPSYIDSDPVCFMHAFTNREDQLIAGFLAALMAWGRRDIVIRKVGDLLDRLNASPCSWLKNIKHSEFRTLSGFKHRTFTEEDVYWILLIISRIYDKHHDFEAFWIHCYRIARTNKRLLMAVFHEEFFDIAPDAPIRTRKHIANPEKNSSCKRLYLFLRWAMRKNSPVDLGIMSFMPLSELMIPLDVHVARQARKLGLLTRYQDDWRAVSELTEVLRRFEPEDPQKYDYALFGIGVLNKVIPDKLLINPRL